MMIKFLRGLFYEKMDINLYLSFRIFLIALCALSIFSCDGKGNTGRHSYKSFDYNLQGTWETNNPGSRYTGILVITYDKITITGYSEDQTPIPAEGGNDMERPFRVFTKNVPLEGYSEEGKIFIKDKGIIQEGLPYIYDGNDYYKQIELLHFKFNGRDETLRKQ